MSRWIRILGVALVLSTFWSAQAAAVVVSLEDDHADDDHDDDHAEESGASSSTEAWFHAIIASIAVSAIGLIGIVAVIANVNIVAHAREAIGFAVGTLLGAVAFVFMPEVSDTIGFGVGGASAMLGGMLAAFTLEFLVHSGHDHASPHGHLDDIESNARAAGDTAAAAAAVTGGGFSNLDAERPDDADASRADGDTRDEQQQQQQGNARPPPAAAAAAVALDTLPLADDRSTASGADVAVATVSSQAPSSSSSSISHNGDSHGHHHHTHGHHGHSHGGGAIRIAGMEVQAFAVVNIVGDLIHNFVDGALIGLTMRDGTRTGWVTALAVAAHEIPQELADFSILVQSGMSVKFALLVNFVTGLAAVLGAVLALGIGEAVEGDSSWALAFSAGLFLYLALADLVPQIVVHGRPFREQLRVAGAVAVGLLLMGLLLLVPREAHAHGAEEEPAH